MELAMDKKTIIAGVVAVIAIIWGITGEVAKGSLKADAEAAKAQLAEVQGKIDEATQAKDAAEKALADATAASQALQEKLDKELEVISSLAGKEPKCSVCAPILDSVERIKQ